MRPLIAYTKKEFMEAARTGKIMILLLLFLLFGIMNPAIAKLTPWMMEMLADTMAESGLIVTEVPVDAMTSWTQFFKNIPMALIAFVLIYSDIFTREYRSGTLLLMVTKGLERHRIVLAKTLLLLSLWTIGYWFCFAVTYGYNAYFWDNDIVRHLFPAAANWWLFGVWTICLIALFSSFLQNSTGVSLCTGCVVTAAYLLSIFPKSQAYTPMLLTDSAPLLTGVGGTDIFTKAIVVTTVLSVLSVAGSIPVINRRQL